MLPHRSLKTLRQHWKKDAIKVKLPREKVGEQREDGTNGTNVLMQFILMIYKINQVVPLDIQKKKKIFSV